jgi:2-isopropylmalate synthase
VTPAIPYTKKTIMGEILYIFDITLRDIKQSLGASMNLKKLPAANQLTVFGVGVIETGFLISSHEDFESLKTLLKSVRNSWICCCLVVF